MPREAPALNGAFGALLDDVRPSDLGDETFRRDAWALWLERGGLLAARGQALSGITPEELDQLAADVQPQVVEWRRWFHQNPELSNREFNTSKRVVEILSGMGLKPKPGIAKTGVVAIIEGGLPGPLVAIRADMDGLPVTEQTGLPFASTAKAEYQGNEVGVMHACGHDSHMAMLLGAAKVLTDVRDELPGSVMLIFPAC